MDKRIALSSGTKLILGDTEYTIHHFIGKGSNAIVYEGEYPDALNPFAKHTVLIKELFPYHEDGGIYRDENGDIVLSPDFPDTEELYRKHYQSFVIGNNIHIAMCNRHPDLAGANINTYPMHGTWYTILGYSGGRSLQKELKNTERTDVTTFLLLAVRRMLGILDALEVFHKDKNKLLHLDIAPDNILLIGSDRQERCILIDYNSVQHKQNKNPSIVSHKEGFSAPELEMQGIEPLSFATDLFSVAATFYYYLAGEPFDSVFQYDSNISNIQCYRNLPSSVLDKLDCILRKGLALFAKERYQSCDEMRKDFIELQDRLNGVGITHWALWEAGRKMIRQLLVKNSALQYLTEEGELYPMNMITDDGVCASSEEWFRKLAAGDKNILLTAPGGMGKSTAMYDAMLRYTQKYDDKFPAVLYVSLFGWNTEQNDFIQNRILDGLRVPDDVKNRQNARQILRHLLNTPLCRNGTTEIPSVLLFLDGLNEASGSVRSLTDEIIDLSEQKGVRIVLSDRNETVGAQNLIGQIFRHLRMTSLKENDVDEILTAHHLLPPDDEKMKMLLQTPIMLSMYLKTTAYAIDYPSENVKSVQSREDLIESYFSMLIGKCRRELTDADAAWWQTEFAIRLVLPAIAGRIAAKKRELTDSELSGTVHTCYSLLTTPILRKTFFQWSIHRKEIYGDCKNANDWYKKIVRDILQGQTGLLVYRDCSKKGQLYGNEQCCHIFHQIFADYLVTVHQANQKKIWKKRMIQISLYGFVSLAALLTGVIYYQKEIAPRLTENIPSPYNEKYAVNIIDYGVTDYIAAGVQYEQLYRLLQIASGRSEDTDYQQNHTVSVIVPVTTQKSMLERLLTSGDVMPWSNTAFDGEHFEKLMNLYGDRKEEYGKFTDILNDIILDKTDIYGIYTENFFDSLNQLLETDAKINSVLYLYVCAVHMTADYYNSKLVHADSIHDIFEIIPIQHKYTQELPNQSFLILYESLKNERRRIASGIQTSGIFDVKILHENKK